MHDMVYAQAGFKRLVQQFLCTTHIAQRSDRIGTAPWYDIGLAPGAAQLSRQFYHFLLHVGPCRNTPTDASAPQATEQHIATQTEPAQDRKRVGREGEMRVAA